MQTALLMLSYPLLNSNVFSITETKPISFHSPDSHVHTLIQGAATGEIVTMPGCYACNLVLNNVLSCSKSPLFNGFLPKLSDNTATVRGSSNSGSVSCTSRCSREQTTVTLRMPSYDSVVQHEEDKKVDEIGTILKHDDWKFRLEKVLESLDNAQKTELAERVFRQENISAQNALNLFLWMDTHQGFSHSSLAQIRVLEILGKAKLFDDMQSLLGQMKGKYEITVELLECVMKCYAADSKLKEAVEVFESIQKDFSKVPCSAYETMLKILVEHRKLNRAQRIFGQMVMDGVDPGEETLRVMIKCLCEKKDVRAAANLLGQLQRRFNVAEEDFNTVINALCKVGMVEDAFQVLENMQKYGIVASNLTWNYLINGLCIAGKPEEALDRLTIMKNTGCAPDIYTYTTLMNHFCKMGRFDATQLLFSEALARDLKPTLVTYNVIMNMHCKAGRIDRALELLEEMPGYGCLPDMVSYSTVIWGCLRNNRISEALVLHEKMQLNGFGLDKRALKFLLWGACTVGEVDKAAQLFRVMQSSRSYSNGDNVFCALIYVNAAAGKMDDACAFLNEFLGDGFNPKVITYNVLIKGFCRAGRFDEAIQMLDFMQKKNTIPDELSYKILATELSKAGRSDEAANFLKAATQAVNE